MVVGVTSLVNVKFSKRTYKPFWLVETIFWKIIRILGRWSAEFTAEPSPL